ncbi:DnaJ-domain-containing protein [Lophium mytilinum]|uniref:DnaJ-domain-containing protein n=1 Tax=Lophium mytilinum TaxID=390894 RepID=A0A6A6RCP5_9PEZI|nr:DnaJ-domain-containing protein [Lophium mytilinum]
MNDVDEVDLYEVLGVTSGASKTEIKKAYHKAALSHHPDKVAEHERTEAEIRFKSAKQAYEILYDDDKRTLYDTHGMAAFDPNRGGPGGPEVDIDDVLAQMFGGGMGGMGGMPGMGGMGGMPGGVPGMGRQPRKGRDVEQEYEVTLEELYKGKTTRFANTKNVVCQTCKGTGGKEKAKPHQCAVCGGNGATTRLRSVGPGLVTQETVPCSTCSGTGSLFKDKARGAREGERIVLAGEADQLPDQEPGDIVFGLVERPHDVFERAGSDLKADLKITLAEALTGLNRVVVTHLDGRGIKVHVQQPQGKVLTPDQVIKVPGEGMPVKKSDAKGDLFLVVKIEFPADGWIKDEETINKIKEALPGPTKSEDAVPETTDEVDIDYDATLEDFGAGSDDPRAGAGWEDDEEEEGGPQCATQ